MLRLLQEVRYAFRQLRKSPAFAAVAVMTLTLGIGCTPAVVSVVDGILLRPLDCPEPSRVVIVRSTQLQYPDMNVSPPDYIDWSRESASFSHVSAECSRSFNLTGDGPAQKVEGSRVTANYFDVFATQPSWGRVFTEEEDVPGNNRVVVLSHGFWLRQFGGRFDAVGMPLTLDDESYRVVGIMPEAFQSISDAELWTPMAFSDAERANGGRGARFLNVIGRLRPGVSTEQASSELTTLARRLELQYPDFNKGWSVSVAPLQDYVVRNISLTLWLLFGVIACVLLVACVNLANLLLARAVERIREMSIRSALGASRWAIVRQLLMEGMALAVLSGILGIAFAYCVRKGLLAILPFGTRLYENARIDYAVLLFAVGVTLVTGFVFSLTPALWAFRSKLNPTFSTDSPIRLPDGHKASIRKILVVSEVAISIVLLAGAGLLVRSFERLVSVDPGFNPDNALLMRLTLPEKKYAQHEQRVAFARQLLSKIETLPGVRSVGLAHAAPMGVNWTIDFQIQGRPPASNLKPKTTYYAVSPGYFQAMGIRLLQGRLFTEEDNENGRPVAIISETLARKYFAGDNPLGKRIWIMKEAPRYSEIIGVVGDVKQSGISKPSVPQAYEPFAQWSHNTIETVIRTQADSTSVGGLLRAAVFSVDRNQPVSSIKPLEDIVAGTVVRQRFAMTLLTIFSCIAVLIAAIGVYGVMAYSVSRRAHEFGIRMALGAQASDVLHLVMTEGGRILTIGLVIGLGGTFFATRVLVSLLYATDPRDPLVLAVAVALFSAVALFACWLPARRASKVEPLVALRYQ